MRPNSEALFERSQKLIPGGVNSPVRAFRSVGGTPVFFERALGAHAWDVDGNRYIDYIGSWGPAILGHADPIVLAAVERAARNGLSFGAPTAGELKLADAETLGGARVCLIFPLKSQPKPTGAAGTKEAKASRSRTAPAVE